MFIKTPWLVIKGELNPQKLRFEAVIVFAN